MVEAKIEYGVVAIHEHVEIYADADCTNDVEQRREQVLQFQIDFRLF